MWPRPSVSSYCNYIACIAKSILSHGPIVSNRFNKRHDSRNFEVLLFCFTVLVHKLMFPNSCCLFAGTARPQRRWLPTFGLTTSPSGQSVDERLMWAKTLRPVGTLGLEATVATVPVWPLTQLSSVCLLYMDTVSGVTRSVEVPGHD